MFKTDCRTEVYTGSQEAAIQCIWKYNTAHETCLYLSFSEEVTKVFYVKECLRNVYHSV